MCTWQRDSTGRLIHMYSNPTSISHLTLGENMSHNDNGIGKGNNGFVGAIANVDTMSNLGGNNRTLRVYIHLDRTSQLSCIIFPLNVGGLR